MVASVATPEHPVSLPHYCKTFLRPDAPLGGRRGDSLREQSPNYMEDVVEYSISVSGWCAWCEQPRVDGHFPGEMTLMFAPFFLFFLMAVFTGPLRSACYAIRSIKPFMSLDVLRSTYFSYAHSIVSYGIIFWGNSSHSEEVFKVQKRIIRIIMNLSKNASFRQTFRDLNILPVPSQCIISVLLFLAKNKDQFMTSSQMHKITTWQTFDLYIPAANLTIY